MHYDEFEIDRIFSKLQEEEVTSRKRRLQLPVLEGFVSSPRETKKKKHDRDITHDPAYINAYNGTANRYQ